MQDVDGSINITVVDRAADIACPYSVRKTQGSLFVAAVTGFGGCKEAIHRYDLSPVPFRLMLQHLHEGTEGGIMERFGQLGSRETLNGQSFDAHRIIGSNQSQCLFV